MILLRLLAGYLLFTVDKLSILAGGSIQDNPVELIGFKK
jgi:hypothetical protein